ncbi:Uncharacterized membrane protein YMR034C [Serendipita indica DSM 11827]|uniref:Uncharacterized protein n=1 Tax=Serendipita indica (strain DSM 11827) TaxID=1109443 RepID=G4TGN3_SERID|nr:Uncharacterized membrane protein YMR034C [Serendipita indica DSM 11827]CCA70490.1 hypothetical protein PIIN_04428 [Serendipita indica DSM 11827]
MTTKLSSVNQDVDSESSVVSQKPEKPEKPLWRRVLSYLIAQWLIFGLGLAILLAWAFPNVGKNGGAIRAEYTVKWGAIALIFLLTGLSLSTKAFLNQALNWHLHLVTQIISFFVFSAVVYGVIWAIVGSGNTHLDRSVLGGIITMGVLPTTLASNVAMTRNAGGNVESATAEVVVGNVVGVFLTPSLLSLYLKPLAKHGFTQPDASGKGGLVGIYILMVKQLSACLFGPLIVGQIIQNLSPTKVKEIQERFKFAIINQVLMLVLVWSTFCGQFATGIFDRVSHDTIILVAFLNVALYLFMSLVCLWGARPPLPSPNSPLLPCNGVEESKSMKKLRGFVKKLTFGKKETAAICFCGAAKGLVLGAPLISIMYSAYGNDVQAAATLPIALYQGTQIAIAQISVRVVKAWILRGDEEEEAEDKERNE